jgi:hypothetical protein
MGPPPPYPESFIARESFGELMKIRAGGALALMTLSRSSSSLLFRRARSFSKEYKDKDEDSKREVATAEARRAEFAAVEAAKARKAYEAAATKAAELAAAEAAATT